MTCTHNTMRELSRSLFLRGDFDAAITIFRALSEDGVSNASDYGWCVLAMLASGRRQGVHEIATTQLSVARAHASDAWVCYWLLIQSHLELHSGDDAKARSTFETYQTRLNLTVADPV